MIDYKVEAAPAAIGHLRKMWRTYDWLPPSVGDVEVAFGLPPDLVESFRDRAMGGVSEALGDLVLAVAAGQQNDDLSLTSVEHRQKIVRDKGAGQVTVLALDRNRVSQFDEPDLHLVPLAV